MIQQYEEYLKSVEESYAEDAYHSLSIEGYRVTAELIERVRSGNWNPDTNEADRNERNAMAGYRIGQVYIKGSMHTPLKQTPD